MTEPILRHEPVMTREVIAALNVRPGGRYVDCTVNGGGHAEAILEAASPGGALIGLDADPEALTMSRYRLRRFGDAFDVVHANFRDVDTVCRDRGFVPVNGVLFDLGLSSHQLASSSRGFSFRVESPIDMRFDSDEGTPASYWVNQASEVDLADLIWRFGEERQSRRIARAIVNSRPIATTTHLAKAVEEAVGRRPGSQTHPATKTFQALRIAVNQELASLAEALPRAHGLLGFGSRLVVISYHSLEDRIVKQFFAQESRDCICPPSQPVCTCGHKATLKLVTRGVLTPSAEEVAANPRSRSAKLRAAERLAA
ncbi:MAG TPA: 16S rRNA (cytosine(1402)-N(4))-methyltransferase RsmH [Dehalococcoidia bacterium]|nr:16S rRNA (cytosine(1402)-N(4))-methyltransferase RsmH [Dehalococcoidia bacterium]